MLAGAERRLELGDRIEELDLAVRGEGKATEEVEGPGGVRAGAGHEVLAEDGKCDIGDGGAARDGRERVLGKRGRLRGERREGGRLDPGAAQGVRERGARPWRHCGGGLEGEVTVVLLKDEGAMLPDYQAVEETGIG